MDNLRAVQICEGLVEASEDDTVCAWQQLIDTGIVWQLQGFFGRHAAHLIETGVCTMTPKEKRN